MSILNLQTGMLDACLAFLILIWPTCDRVISGHAQYYTSQKKSLLFCMTIIYPRSLQTLQKKK